VSTFLASPVVLAGRPLIIGVVNITEDSFSDGGRYLAAEDALAHAWRLRAEGADVIELGPAASHPDAARVAADDQRRRLAPVMEQLTAGNVPVSVDSFLPDVQRFAAGRGAAYLNDIRGFPDPSLYDGTHDVAALSDALTVLQAIAGRA
jgi:dihydropteroate synthase type 2